MAEVSGGVGKAGCGRGAAAGAGRMAKRKAATKKGSKRRERSGSRAARGAARLKEDLDRELKRHSGKLAKLLMEMAGGGDLPSLRFAVSLAEQHAALAVDQGPYRSMALAFADEPEWTGPAPVLVDREGRRLEVEDPEMERGGRTASELPFSDEF